MRPGDLNLIKDDDENIDRGWTFRREDFPNKLEWNLLLGFLGVEKEAEVLEIEVEMTLNCVIRRTAQ